MNLFEGKENEIVLPLRDAEVSYFPNFISSEVADQYFEHLLNETDWQQDDIKIFGKVYAQPRLTALYGESGKPYSYSGITMHPKPFPPILSEIKQKVEAVSKVNFTTVLLNLYRDGNDSNGWHSDDEKELGTNPVIASLSLGTKRKFHLRHKTETSLKSSLELEHGSLLLMKGSTQHFWKHQLPKSKRIHDPRINLTFRVIKA
ncbi:alpha-ketoglutarate-dependent dioxygenase AlkB [Aureitalea sp. L0-47]|uniref:alpha-ketoglutarate-dependent dioxygenase AlkB family protein n=1 Tax=Aureitalea sp. L0-47 TaxID=2816962 RepID=UPI00223709A7|nr:alpha-ketoglutarate-dependent dioxygenase AlkB [Aureitalea sp. L0-47]MCW5520260.1 alpha-ketoglutarate-dependent dioxygenase AlkB [Aureitalea sp. L0-47]